MFLQKIAVAVLLYSISVNTMQQNNFYVDPLKQGGDKNGACDHMDEDTFLSSLEIYPFGHEAWKGGLDFSVNCSTGRKYFRFTSSEEKRFAELISADDLKAYALGGPIEKRPALGKLHLSNLPAARAFAKELYVRVTESIQRNVSSGTSSGPLLGSVSRKTPKYGDMT